MSVQLSTPLLHTYSHDSLLNIHSTAIVHPNAQLGLGVIIGAYSIIGEHVIIGDNTTVGSHVVIDGWTRIGGYNHIATGAIIGTPPQDLKFAGEESYLCIGHHNIIREYATINRGTKGGGYYTRIGDHNLIMISAHIAHDVQIGHHNIIANAAGIGGHVVIADWCNIGYASGIHQFVKLGSMSMVGACSMIRKDVSPFTLVQGNPAQFCGINFERLRRNGYSPTQRAIIKQAYRILFNEGLKLEDAIEKIKKTFSDNGDVACIIHFLQHTERGIYRNLN